MSEKITQNTYRIEGLSCTNCAGKFKIIDALLDDNELFVLDIAKNIDGSVETIKHHIKS